MTALTRRDTIGAALGLAGSALSQRAMAAAGRCSVRPTLFSFERLKAAQTAAATRPYAPAPGDRALGGVGYDAMRRMNFRPERSLWVGSDGREVRFFPRNQYADRAVRVFAVEAGQAREVLFTPDLFDIADPALAQRMAAIAGFLRVPGDERPGQGRLAGLQGFVATLAAPIRSTSTGLSARGIAIDTGTGLPRAVPRLLRLLLERDAAGRP